MKRTIALSIVLLSLLAHGASAQDWARKMFESTNHAFGTVARGSKQEFEFKFKNLYKEDVHVSAVRSSCGCTTPRVTKDDVKTGETSSVIATYNTNSFLGAKSATLTVVIDKPFYAEVQLTVDGYIRSDVVLNPGVVEFGAIQCGSGAEVKVDVAYAGRSDWEIADIRSANEHFEVELVETRREAGQVRYAMVVRLKPDAPVGFINDQLTIVTNDGSAHKNVILPVEGQVESPLSVSPASLFLGVLNPGEKVKKMLVVKANKPFKITDIKCEDQRFAFTSPAGEAKAIHFVPVEYTAGESGAKVAQRIQIETDLGGNALVAECVATATVKQ